MAASIAVFTVIGLVTRFDQKGNVYSLADLYVANFSDLVSGRADGVGLMFVTFGLVVWVGVSMLLGWLVQCIVVTLICRGHD